MIWSKSEILENAISSEPLYSWPLIQKKIGYPLKNSM